MQTSVDIPIFFFLKSWEIGPPLAKTHWREHRRLLAANEASNRLILVTRASQSTQGWSRVPDRLLGSVFGIEPGFNQAEMFLVPDSPDGVEMGRRSVLTLSGPFYYFFQY